MTILEDDVISLRPHKTTTCSNSNEQLKRKYSFEEPTPSKRRACDMLKSTPPVATLSNMGNTCFLNSVLYTLRFAPTFLHNLHHLIIDLGQVEAKMGQTRAKTSSLGRSVVGAITGPSARSTSSKDLPSLGGGAVEVVPKAKVQVVTERLHELFQVMHYLESNESPATFQPVALLQAVREANSIFEGNNQQDAHELLVYLLDNIRETGDVLAHQVRQWPGLLGDATVETTAPTPAAPNGGRIWARRPWNKGNKHKDKTAISEEHISGTNNSTDTGDSSGIDSNNGSTGNRKIGYNFVAEDFEGITLRRTKCLECECVTERKETFYDIPVPISVQDVHRDAVSNDHDFFRRACVTTEKLCDGNKYLCEECSRYNEASREVLFEKLPNMMILQLKRFTTTTSGVQKVNTYLPTPLVLRCFCEKCCKSEEIDGQRAATQHRYQLHAVIMHVGGSLASGHYIAYVRAAADPPTADYADCPRDPPKASLSAGSSEKALNIVNKLLRPRAAASFGGGGGGAGSVAAHGVRVCKSIECCGLRLNRHTYDAFSNGAPTKRGDRSTPTPPASARLPRDAADVWLECDDENVRPITSEEFVEELSFKPNSTSTPYLLFYAKMAAD